MGSWFYEGKYAVQFTVGEVTKDSWEDFKMIPEKKPVMQAPDLGLRLFKRFEFSTTYIIEDNDEVNDILEDIIDFMHGKTGTITVDDNDYTAKFNIVDITAEDHYTKFKVQAILSDFVPDANNTITFPGSPNLNTWTDWNLIPDQSFVITPPPLKEKYVDVPGRNGAIDLTNAVMGAPRFDRMTGDISFTIYNDNPDSVYNDMLDKLHGHKFNNVTIAGAQYDGRWVIKSYSPDGEEPKIVLSYNLIKHVWSANEQDDAYGGKAVEYVGCTSYRASYTADVKTKYPKKSLIQFVDRTCGYIPLNAAGNDHYYGINWATDNWEIGMAMCRIANDGKVIIGQAHFGWAWKYVPSIEWFSDNTMAMYYSSNGSDWNNAFSYSNFAQLKQWVFLSVAYDPTNTKLTVKYTFDFNTWTSHDYTLTFHSNTDPIGFGYWFDGDHTNQGIVFDTDNVYLKKNGEIVCGAFSERFYDGEM